MVEATSDDPKGIAPQRQFRSGIADARLSSFRKDARTRVRDEHEFDAMKAHLLAVYDGVDVRSSFTDAAGQVFDCVPVEQQPSLKASGDAAAEPPSLAVAIGHDETRPADTQRSAGRAVADADEVDRHGNPTRCPPGFVPLRRVTLDELTRFRTLDDYFRKGFPAPLAPTAPSTDIKLNHRYAYAHQELDALGGHSFINLRAPSVSGDEIFSLAQHWYSAGTGTAHQTVEIGWQVFPTKYGHSQPVLFIYWTADNYKTTGAYNLDAAGFVQTNPAWTLGGALSPVGDPGGQQYEIEVAVYLSGGNWWLYVGGLQPENAIGYYPTSIYNGGAMASHATAALYGGETLCGATGPWSEMGSGAFSGAIWPHAAWHRSVFVLPTGGGAQWATLKGESPSPACYDQFVGNYAAPWNVTLFFGGPGGANC